MHYRHAPAAHFADLDAVLASAPGRPSLPVRLTLELFGRCRDHLGGPGPVVVWDPCCGTAQLLTTLGLLRRDEVAGLVGSDADPEPLELAGRNLALLGPGGLRARAAELDALAGRHDKPGYRDAAAAARRLDRPVTGPPTPGPPTPGLPTEVGVADALDPAATGAIVARHRPRIVLADVPYGRQTRWAGPAAPAADETGLVAALARALDPDAVIAVVARARKVVLPAGVSALERVRAGHRAAAIVRAGDVP
ncbi:rRNA methyltransferase [Pseudonocardia sp. KRD291]|uniref:rRNA methyltransferase n=1 Tax=Pseudonocardia sp. KRD291 TaxID=2792007 RepID=UPI001C49D51F|nr:rRNA methyltransferase [Pseudonocardia sp. KRD291]MBW0105550.1 rRNA methyltransferase [Pseudonocardia sp. KRD291]